MVRRILLAVNGSHRIVWLIRELGAGTQGVPAQLWQLDEERRIMTYRSAVKCWETMPCNANATARWARSRVAFPFQPLHVRNPKYAMNGNGSWQQSPSEGSTQTIVCGVRGAVTEPVPSNGFYTTSTGDASARIARHASLSTPLPTAVRPSQRTLRCAVMCPAMRRFEGVFFSSPSKN